MEEVYISSQVKRFFERVVSRYLKEPERFHGCPLPSPFLIYGHGGSNMTAGILSLTDESELDVCVWKCSRSPKETQKNLKEVEKWSGDMLVIRNAQYLPHMPQLFDRTMKLSKVFGDAFKFIVVISKQVPDYNAPFWSQFDKFKSILYELPPRDWRINWLKNVWNNWTRPVELSEEDYAWLADACHYTTPQDMEVFVGRVKNAVIEAEPEEVITVNRFFIESRFVFESQGTVQNQSICEHDRFKQWSALEHAIGKVTQQPKSLQQSEAFVEEQVRLKRMKIDKEKDELCINE